MGVRVSDAPNERYFTSNRLAADQVPAAPDTSLARARHYMRMVGSALVVNCDAGTVWLTVNGAEKVCELSIWIV